MSKYLNRISFIIDFYNADYHEQHVKDNQYTNSLKDRKKYIEFYYLPANERYRRQKFISNRLNFFFHAVAGTLMSKVGKYPIVNTSILNFQLNNYPNPSPTRYSLGEYVNKCGFIIDYFDFADLLLKTDLDKHRTILKYIYEHLLTYTKMFSLPDEPFIQAYQSVKDRDLFITSAKSTTSPGRQYKVTPKYRQGFETIGNWLVFENRKTGVVKDFFIRDIEMFYGDEHPELTIHDILKIPRFIDYEGWSDTHTYKMRFGKTLYLFHAESEQLVEESER